jgi:beta-galactosidase
MEWKVWYEPGVLTAKAYNKGVFVAETKVETTGSPASIRLTPYRSQLAADGEDTIPVTVEILDDQGRLVPTADNEVIFQVQGQGEIAGVGNGDPSSHEPDKASKRRAFNGLCMALVRATDRPGEIILTAESQGLPKALVILRASEKIFKKQN